LGFYFNFCCKNSTFSPNTGGFFQELKFFTVNSRILAENSRIFLKNSGFWTFQELEMPEKASKKAWPIHYLEQLYILSNKIEYFWHL